MRIQYALNKLVFMAFVCMSVSACSFVKVHVCVRTGVHMYVPMKGRE